MDLLPFKVEWSVLFKENDIFYVLIMSCMLDQTSNQVMFLTLKDTLKSYTIYFYFLKPIKEVSSCYQNIVNNLCTLCSLESFKRDFFLE